MSAPPARLHAAAPPTPPPAPRPHRGRQVLRYLVAALFTLAVAVLTLPDLFGLDTRSPFAQLVSLRPLVLACGVGLLALLLLVLRFERRVWPFVAGVLAVVLVGGSMVLPRVIADPVPAGGRPLTVLTFNTFGGAGDVDALATLIAAERPDVVSVVEAGVTYRNRLAPLVQPLGYRLHTLTGPRRSDVGGVTAIVSGDMGEVGVRIGEETSSFPYVELSGGGLGALRFVAFHAVAPVPGSVPDWRSDLALVQQWCAGPTPAVVAGDFNATLDHSALRAGMAGCVDAGEQRGAGLVPTWGPSPRTRIIGPQIDHVIATDGIDTETFDVRDVPGSDHRAVLTRLRIPS